MSADFHHRLHNIVAVSCEPDRVVAKKHTGRGKTRHRQDRHPALDARHTHSVPSASTSSDASTSASPSSASTPRASPRPRPLPPPQHPPPRARTQPPPQNTPTVALLPLSPLSLPLCWIQCSWYANTTSPSSPARNELAIPSPPCRPRAGPVPPAHLRPRRRTAERWPGCRRGRPVSAAASAHGRAPRCTRRPGACLWGPSTGLGRVQGISADVADLDGARRFVLEVWGENRFSMAPCLLCVNIDLQRCLGCYTNIHVHSPFPSNRSSNPPRRPVVHVLRHMNRRMNMQTVSKYRYLIY